MTNTITVAPASKRQRRMARELQGNAAAPEQGAPPTGPVPARPSSKAAQVLTMLKSPEGATIAQLVAATDWLPHTTRAALTGLKKKGHAITSEKLEGGARVYRAAPGAAA